MQKVPITPYPLRMPPDLRLQLEEMAAKKDRSLNKEIVRRLQESFKQKELAR